MLPSVFALQWPPPPPPPPAMTYTEPGCGGSWVPGPIAQGSSVGAAVAGSMGFNPQAASSVNPMPCQTTGHWQPGSHRDTAAYPSGFNHWQPDAGTYALPGSGCQQPSVAQPLQQEVRSIPSNYCTGVTSCNSLDIPMLIHCTCTPTWHKMPQPFPCGCTQLVLGLQPPDVTLARQFWSWQASNCGPATATARTHSQQQPCSQNQLEFTIVTSSCRPLTRSDALFCLWNCLCTHCHVHQA